MRAWPLLIWAAVLAAPAPGLAQASSSPVVVSAKIGDAAVTVYRAPNRGAGPINPNWPQGFAFITETRTVTLPAGISVLRFEGVAEGLLPETAVVSGLPDGVIEKNRDARLLSPAGLVDAYLKRSVTLRRTSLATGKVVEQEAVIQSGPNGGVIVQTAAGVEALACSGLPERMLYRQVPKDLSAKPTLSILVESKAARTVKVQLLYLAEGFDWAANYVADRGTDGKTLGLTGWITVANGGVTSFPGAQLNVIAGRLNKMYSPPLPRSTPGALVLKCWPMDITSTHPLWELPPIIEIEQNFQRVAEEVVVTARRREDRMMYAMAPPPPPPPPPPAPIAPPAEDLGDLKFYRIPFRVDVSAKGQKQVALLAKDKVAVEQLYAATLYNYGDGRPQPLMMRLRVQNRESDGLGLALPAGMAAVFEAIGGRRLLVGEAAIGDKAKDERVDYDIGSSPAVQYKVTVQPDPNADYRLWQVTLTNARPFDAEVEMLIPFDLDPTPQGWERRGSSWVWRVRVPANDSLTQAFRQKLKGD
ncbi:hypothetical protein SAMN05428974_1959 [Sphingopyxis sp. YR583]|uniref:DUF4139 domain-containing protein n=1 Tax=Sphingopyxis sp. YR583 TaxID=1881047 RepID=UPI0008A78B30|nr:hypothetical protein [Sphingopyxis sp. YR583]SEH16860.1 hypothetical protein SAMN05428974_1959 [Sphingopyxis sp. YR583]